jgi:hypothetical protein
MLFEALTLHNLFSALGGVTENPAIREGRVRSQGPFAHAILAGTIGAVCLPLVIALWQRHRKAAVVGITACSVMIVTAASSGPIISAIGGLGALAMWHYRHQLRLVRWIAVAAYIGLDIVMKAPAYYLIGRIDLAGGSTGYHRAALIESAIVHLNEWWLAGTDYTRHWMPTGVSWSPNHTDITNHYLEMGVVGGLPLLVLFILVLVKGFSSVGRMLRQSKESAEQWHFTFWALGASLFAHAATFVSVSYFDQSFVFIYLTLAALGSTRPSRVPYGTARGKAYNGVIRSAAGQPSGDATVLGIPERRTAQ